MMPCPAKKSTQTHISREGKVCTFILHNWMKNKFKRVNRIFDGLICPEGGDAQFEGVTAMPK
jgi:hypothetical protein